MHYLTTTVVQAVSSTEVGAPRSSTQPRSGKVPSALGKDVCATLTLIPAFSPEEKVKPFPASCRKAAAGLVQALATIGNVRGDVLSLGRGNR